MQIKIIFIHGIFTTWLFIFSFLAFDVTKNSVRAQEPIFELPVQLVGFPVIIMAVRLSNFVKKLAYSLNPQTYKPAVTTLSPSINEVRVRRSTQDEVQYHSISHNAIDMAIAEKRILTEFGPKACVLEEPCRIHAVRSGEIGEQPDWDDILENYKVQSTGMKQWYLLSVFLGDVIRDVSLCRNLAKRLKCTIELNTL